MYEYACRHVFFPAWKMMRSRWWAGWCEKAIQQSEKMPGMRACDEEERTDRQGHATVEMPDLPAELDDAAARPQTGADAGGVLLMDSGAVVPDGPGIHGRRARPAQADRMVLVNPATHRPAGREAPHGHGRRHVHGPRLVPDYRHRRRERRSPRLPVVRARVQGRLPGPVLRDPHARRADHRRAARRGGGVPGDVARHPDPSPSGACATQHPHRPDLQTPTPGRQGIEKLSGLLTGVETAEEAVGWGEALNAWHERWKGFIAERTFARDDPANPKASRRMRWWTHEEPRRCYRRLEKLFCEGKLFAFLEPALAAGGPVARTTNRLEGGVNSVVKNVLRNHRGLSEEHMLRACEWVCYMKTAHPRLESFIPNDPLEDGKATSPEPEGDVSPAYGIGVDWNEFHTGTRYPNGTD